MAMEQAIKGFAKQFAWKPVIIYGDRVSDEPETRSRELARYKKFVICGMGGSNLAADLLRIREPKLDLLVHKDYGLPKISASELRSRLIIASSYSGNTEETLSSFLEARQRKLAVVAITTGAKLLKLAQAHHVPFIQIPNPGIQPRMALGFSIKALLKFIGNAKLDQEATQLSQTLQPLVYAQLGHQFARAFYQHVPVIYASARNFGLAYNWKIKFNETGKIPAFCNVFPELNHNEMTGLDVKPSSRILSKNLAFIFLYDGADHPRIQKRMQIMARLYRSRKLPVRVLKLPGRAAFHKIFSSLLLADWTALHTAQLYGLEPEQVPMVEEFKALMV